MGLSFAMVQPTLDCGLPQWERLTSWIPRRKCAAAKFGHWHGAEPWFTIFSFSNEFTFSMIFQWFSNGKWSTPRPLSCWNLPSFASSPGVPSQACSCQVQAARMQPGRQLYSSGGPSWARHGLNPKQIPNWWPCYHHVHGQFQKMQNFANSFCHPFWKPSPLGISGLWAKVPVVFSDILVSVLRRCNRLHRWSLWVAVSRCGECRPWAIATLPGKPGATRKGTGMGSLWEFWRNEQSWTVTEKLADVTPCHPFCKVV